MTVSADGTPPAAAPLVEALELTHRYPRRGRSGADSPPALDGISFTIERGQTFGVVGESGSGKSTLTRILCGLLEPASGSVRFAGQDVYGGSGLRSQLHQHVQLVMQDPYSSLNPRARITTILERPLILRGRQTDERRSRVRDLLDMVGLNPQLGARMPSDLSGGQRQRVAIARALAAEPELLVLDEPTSALDLSSQAHVVNLLSELRRDLGLSYVFVSHNLALVAYFCDDTLVMQGGTDVEHGSAQDLYFRPRHPYTRELMTANTVRHPPGSNRVV